MPLQPTHRVASTALNFRSAPDLQPSNRIAVLSSQQPVEKLAEHDASWWRVAVELHGRRGD
ncbi:MAG: SH3 domain-containing protein, partial [Thermoanaerobaculia bacterium]|nr:SH3 domain-containing protein [Thermoanaerobaculia bacterium]